MSRAAQRPSSDRPFVRYCPRDNPGVEGRQNQIEHAAIPSADNMPKEYTVKTQILTTYLCIF
jgi:hypothetical protein